MVYGQLKVKIKLTNLLILGKEKDDEKKGSDYRDSGVDEESEEDDEDYSASGAEEKGKNSEKGEDYGETDDDDDKESKSGVSEGSTTAELSLPLL